MLDRDYLNKIFLEKSLSVTDEQFQKLDKYAEMLVEWNKMVNLTALLSPADIAEKHFLDSILPFNLFDFSHKASLIDVGTGAGFPSCPLKIMYPELDITLLDSLNKRVKFLNALSDELSLNAECVHGRAEEFAQDDEYREQFDYATARAVASLPMLCEYCIGFVKVGGYFVALKGSNAEAEIENSKSAIKILGGKIEKVIEYTLSSGDKRTLILIKKISQTNPKYPRNKGRMTKKPL